MEELKKKIEEKGLKIKWVADTVGVSPTLLSMYLSGNRNMPKKVLKKINKLISK